MTDPKKPKLLVIADHAVPTGFARVAENLCRRLQTDWELYVVGINYYGQPHDYPYHVWPAKLHGDIWGIGTFNALIPQLKPDAIFTVQDPWIAVRYANEIDRGDTPLAAYMPVDAKNQARGVCYHLNKLDLAIFYTKFGEVECRLAGYKGKGEVIPHGANTELYRPISREEARSRMLVSAEGKPFHLSEDAFIVGNINRNQPRKRLDLTIQYFADWVRRFKIPDNVFLSLHCAQQEPAGWDLPALAYYYGISNRLILPDARAVTPASGLPEIDMPYIYATFDVQVSTTAGEGWGLSQIEGMACGIPQIVPQFGALAEWAAGAAYMVPCSDERVAHPHINTIGACPDKEIFIRALDRFYRNPELRSKYAAMALERAREPRFNWDNIADRFKVCLDDLYKQAAEKPKTERESDGKEA